MMQGWTSPTHSSHCQPHGDFRVSIQQRLCLPSLPRGFCTLAAPKNRASPHRWPSHVLSSLSGRAKALNRYLATPGTRRQATVEA
ncbi:uncharacterized protein LOC144280549 isoform X5 [Canis aureus]